MKTKHFEVRSQQRGICAGHQRLLDDFGDVRYDGAGHRIIYMSKRSKREMEREFGRLFVARLGSCVNMYRVETSSGECQITTGFRFDRIRQH
jgi:hypothetical protein